MQKNKRAQFGGSKLAWFAATVLIGIIIIVSLMMINQEFKENLLVLLAAVKF